MGCFDKAIKKIQEDNCKTRYICCIGPTGPQGEAGVQGIAGAIGPTGPTERFFKSSNKIIIDSSLIIPYNEKKIIYFTIIPKKCHFFFCNYFHNKTF